LISYCLVYHHLLIFAQLFDEELKMDNREPKPREAANRVAFTDKALLAQIKAAKKEGKARYVWAESPPGLGLYCSPLGRGTFVYLYRRQGKQHRINLDRDAVTGNACSASYGTVTIKEAERRLARMAGEIAAGRNPAEARKQQDAKLRAQLSTGLFRDVAESYFNGMRKKDGKPRASAKGTGAMREFIKPALDAFGGKPAATITKADVEAMLATLDGKTAMKRACYMVCHSILAAAVKAGVCDNNVFEKVDAPPVPAARKRKLSGEEIRRLWAASAKLKHPHGIIIRLCLLTGCRPIELLSLRWDWIDVQARAFELPEGFAKNSEPHLVALSDLAWRILGEAPANAKEHVFAVKGDMPPSQAGLTLAKAELDKAMGDIPGWQIRDLRRTFYSGLQALGFPITVTEACVNHVSGTRDGVAGVYGRHEYRDECKAAWAAWSEHVSRLVGANVIPLETAQAA
jgi:integrase